MYPAPLRPWAAPVQPGRRPRALAALLLCASVALPSGARADDPPADKGPEKPAAPEKAPDKQRPEHRFDVHSFSVVENYSGSVSYYQVIEHQSEPFIRASYRPPLETVTLGVEVPDFLRQATKKLRWKWRALVLPKGGDECAPGLGDSAAVVYVTWKRRLKWYTLKYVWSAVGKKGQVCDQRRNLFVVQDTVIRQSGAPLGVWVEEEIDPSAEFRNHFEDGNPNADVPDFVGIGIMSDGDQTRSLSMADYAGFTIVH